MLPQLRASPRQQEEDAIRTIAANLREIPVQLVVAKKHRGLKAAACDASGQARSVDVDEFREMPFIRRGCAERSLGEFDLDNVRTPLPSD